MINISEKKSATKRFDKNDMSAFEETSIIDYNNEEYFHRAIGKIFIVFQFVGILPVSGFTSKSINNLKFKKFSLRALYAYFIFFSICLVMVRPLIETTKIGFENINRALSIRLLLIALFEVIVYASYTIFLSCILLINLLFFFKRHKWISIQKEWRSLDERLDKFKCEKLKLCKKFKIITIIFLILGVIDEELYLFDTIFYGAIFGETMNNNDSILSNSISMIVYQFKDNLNTSLFYEIKTDDFMSNFFGTYLFITARIAAIIFFIADIIIILIAIGIGDEYKRLNKRMIKLTDQQLNYVNWNEARQCYATLSALVKKIDGTFSGIILLAFFQNVFVIYINILYSGLVTVLDPHLFSTYAFYGSFSCVLTQAILTTLAIARIYHQHSVIIPVLYNCPSENYTIEVQRLQHQLGTDKVVLTGNRFFYINRNFFLVVIGAFFTYQKIVLNQDLEEYSNKT